MATPWTWPFEYHGSSFPVSAFWVWLTDGAGTAVDGESYGTDPWGRFAALLSTGFLFGLGGLYYLVFQRRRTGILPDHAAEEIPDAGPMDLDVLAGPGGLIGQFAPGE